MKTFLFAFVLLASHISMAAAEVDFPETNPIKVKAVQMTQDQYEYNLLDSNGALRMRFDKDGEYYVYQNSSSTNAVKKSITEESFNQIILLVRNTSSRCPVEFTLSRPSFDITNASSPCDPMAFTH